MRVHIFKTRASRPADRMNSHEWVAPSPPGRQHGVAGLFRLADHATHTGDKQSTVSCVLLATCLAYLAWSQCALRNVGQFLSRYTASDPTAVSPSNATGWKADKTKLYYFFNKKRARKIFQRTKMSSCNELSRIMFEF
jgi:hypothetical protein